MPKGGQVGRLMLSLATGQHFRPKSIDERFWSKVDRVSSQKACWLWLASKNKKGYGCFDLIIEGRKVSGVAHRAAWYFTFGLIQDDLCVLHRCDNPPCCNPNHLFLGTIADNNKDARHKGRNYVGDKNSHCKTTRKDALAIQALYYKKRWRRLRIAKAYGISIWTVGRICRGETWHFSELET